ncbi:MAG: type I pullulanase [Muribaculaceae bacterium]|nr:type I pullulanase [Muribaculaceae bacterium]MDY3932789.1 type I pullulanase [Muribaculaceae bacterium]
MKLSLKPLAIATSLVVASLPMNNSNNVSAAEAYPETQYSNYPVALSFDREFHFSNNAGVFELWSPKAQQAKVNIYSRYNDTTPEMTVEMILDPSNGIWHTTAGTIESLIGKFYTFQIKNNGKWLDETPGIWARALSVNGEKAAIIDFNLTNPEGWQADHGPKVAHQTDAIIYEMHHRDFSVHANSGIKNKGKFIALTEKGTRSANGEPTGIDHLKELGITHIHILPSYDFNSVDETNLQSGSYNWGYDPINYNTPDGSYSTNPYDPATRIKEMKQMIKALHDEGLGVVMDVVYNHTAIGDGSNFSLTVPGYFYRHRADGSYSDASGCGNETASDRIMVRQYIINSVKYWAKEYHIDGFRFDLMGIHDATTMTLVAKELKKINPNIIIYGEGWTAGDSPLPAKERALKDNAMMIPGCAVFSDDIRDGIKGHYSKADDRGFATGKIGNKETIKFGIVGAVAHPQINYSKCNNSKAPYAISPLQVVNYVSCHDDLTLTDKLAASMPEYSVEERQRAAKLAQTIVFTSQGMPFMFAGEEVFRDKKGVHNSYKSPDDINAIDWNMKHENRELFDYYRELIRLRRSHPAFRMTSADDVVSHIRFDNTKSESLISYSITGNANGDSWNEIKLIFNGSDADMTVNVKRGDWKIIARDGVINADGIGSCQGGKLTVEHRSALILAR